MGTPYEYVRMTVRSLHDGHLRVSVGLMRADGSHKYPRTVRRPWEHVYSLPSDMTMEGLFWRMKFLLSDLANDRPEAPAPPEGATGGPDVPLPGL